MGIYDRDYYRTPTRGGFADLRLLSVTTWLIVINAAVFLLDGMLGTTVQAVDRFGYPRELAQPSVIYQWGYFSLTTAVLHGQVWRFITYQFLHASIGHIFFNMLGLFFFGPIVESQLGGKRYLVFYLSCGVAGALMYLLLWSAHVLIMPADIPMIGASACIFGVLLAAARLVPDLTITLLFPPIPISLKFLAWFYVAVAAYSVMTSGQNSGAEAAHLGGALWGFVLVRHEHWLDYLLPRPLGAAVRKRRRVAFRDWSRDQNH